MDRRSVLVLAASGGLAVTAGCLAGEENCPEPDFENERPYEVRSPTTTYEVETGIKLATSLDNVDNFLSEELNGELDGRHKEWVRETDFEESVVAAIRETSGGGPGNSDFEILGVDQESEDTTHIYTCIAEIAAEDVAYSYTRLLRISYNGQTPDSGQYTHWQEGNRSTYEVNV